MTFRFGPFVAHSSAKLGSGHFGTVLAGVHRKTGEHVAVKLERAQSSAAGDAVAAAPRLSREAAVYRKLDGVDFFPRLRAHADKLAVIRSCHADSHAHGSALVQMNTGMPLIGRPSLGSWVSYGLGSENDSLPAHVVILDKRGGPISGQPNWSSGFMPATYQGTLFRPTGSPVLDLAGPGHLDRGGQRNQLDLLGELNAVHLAERPGGSELAARIQTYELAYRMQSSVPELMDISRESQETLEAYGASPGNASFANNCLLARRLAEAGVRFIQLYDRGWDHHGDVTTNIKSKIGQVDKPCAALIKDLRQRGLLDETLVIWGGEFGRTSYGQDRGKSYGRDHHPNCFSLWMAGGGIKGGVTIGETDDFGYNVAKDKVEVHDLHATMLHLLGIDHERLTYKFKGRDFRLTDVAGNVVQAALA